jgi:hypothetical protein
MLYTSYVVGITVLAVSPLLFLITRLLAKRSRRLPWSIDDTLLVLALVQSDLGTYCASCIADRPLAIPVCIRGGAPHQQVIAAPHRQHGVSNATKS